MIVEVTIERVVRLDQLLQEAQVRLPTLVGIRQHQIDGSTTFEFEGAPPEGAEAALRAVLQAHVPQPTPTTPRAQLRQALASAAALADVRSALVAWLDQEGELAAPDTKPANGSEK